MEHAGRTRGLGLHISLITSPEMEPRPTVGGFPGERVSLDNLPEG